MMQHSDLYTERCVTNPGPPANRQHPFPPQFPVKVRLSTDPDVFEMRIASLVGADNDGLPLYECEDGLTCQPVPYTDFLAPVE